MAGVLPTVLFGLFVSNFVAEAGARIENTSGVRPTGPTATSSAVSDFEVTPMAGLMFRTRQNEAGVRYRPRIFARIPNSLERPLLLHQADARARHTFSRTVSTDATFSFQAGEVDYGAAELLVDQGSERPPATLPESEILNVLRLRGTLGTDVSLSRIQRFRVAAAAGYTAPDEDAGTFSGESRGELDITSTTQLSTNHSWIGIGSVELIRFTGGATFRTFGLLTGWEGAFSSRTRARLLVGVLFARSDSLKILPRGQAQLTLSIAQTRSFSISASAEGGVDGYADLFRATYDPRAFARIGLLSNIGPRLEVGLSASIITLAARRVDPIPTTAGALLREDTVVSAELPVRYRLSRQLQLECAGGVAMRGPHLEDPNFELGRIEATVRVAAELAYELPVQ